MESQYTRLSLLPEHGTRFPVVEAHIYIVIQGLIKPTHEHRIQLVVTKEFADHIDSWLIKHGVFADMDALCDIAPATIAITVIETLLSIYIDGLPSTPLKPSMVALMYYVHRWVAPKNLKVNMCMQGIFLAAMRSILNRNWNDVAIARFMVDYVPEYVSKFPPMVSRFEPGTDGVRAIALLSLCNYLPVDHKFDCEHVKAIADWVSSEIADSETFTAKFVEHVMEGMKPGEVRVRINVFDECMDTAFLLVDRDTKEVTPVLLRVVDFDVQFQAAPDVSICDFVIDDSSSKGSVIAYGDATLTVQWTNMRYTALTRV
jgi:hypothetical protein